MTSLGSNQNENSFENFLNFSAEILKKNKLPTTKDLLQYFVYLRSLHIPIHLTPNEKILCNIIVELKVIWNSANIPTLTDFRIKQKFEESFNAWKSLIKRLKSNNHHSEVLKKDVNIFLDKIDKLFDIAECKCSRSCSCPEERRLPHEVLEFLSDQREKREKFIVENLYCNSQVSTPSAKAKKRGRPRKIANLNDNEVDNTRVVQEPESTEDMLPARSDSPLGKRKRLENPEKKSSGQCRIPLPKSAAVCERFRMSDRKVAFLATALFEDFLNYYKVDIPPTDLVIDRSKIRRERAKVKKSKIILIS